MTARALLRRCSRCHFRLPGAGRSFPRLATFSRVESRNKVLQLPAAERFWNSLSRSFSSNCTQEDPSEEAFGYSAEMEPHIRSCLSQRGGHNVTEKSIRDTGFIVSFLGTGGGMPTKHRMTSATVLRLGGLSFLFDAGEGLQRQLNMSTVNVGQVSKIFITHLHGDHIFGLPGLLLNLRIAAVESSKKETRVVDIYGPPGLHTFIAANLALSCSAFAGLKVIVHELVGGQAEGGPRGKRWGGGSRKNIFLGSYPELANSWLHKKSIDRNDDGTWTIDDPNDVLQKVEQNLLAPNDVNAGPLRRLRISAAEVTHLPGIQTFGFVVQELEPPRKIDPEKATSLGVRPGPKYKLLKNGFPVMSDDGKNKVQPDSVLLDATTKARKFALIGDNCCLSPAMARLCKDADVLVHEATIGEGNASEAIVRGHSSAETTGKVAKCANAKVLVLNHIPPGVFSKDAIDGLVERVERTNEGVSRIVASHDFMELVVPRLGFNFDQQHDEELESVHDTPTTAVN